MNVFTYYFLLLLWGVYFSGYAQNKPTTPAKISKPAHSRHKKDNNYDQSPQYKKVRQNQKHIQKNEGKLQNVTMKGSVVEVPTGDLPSNPTQMRYERTQINSNPTKGTSLKDRKRRDIENKNVIVAPENRGIVGNPTQMQYDRTQINSNPTKGTSLKDRKRRDIENKMFVIVPEERGIVGNPTVFPKTKRIKKKDIYDKKEAQIWQNSRTTSAGSKTVSPSSAPVSSPKPANQDTFDEDKIEETSQEEEKE